MTRSEFDANIEMFSAARHRRAVRSLARRDWIDTLAGWGCVVVTLTACAAIGVMLALMV